MIFNLLYAFIGIGIIFLILRLVDIAYKRMLIPVEKVGAGTAKRTDYSISPFESFYHNGKKVNPKKYIIRIVDGNCMVPRNIYAGDLLFIEKFNGDPDSLTTGDILFIKRENGGCKIREYKGRDTNNEQQVKTLLYEENGAPRDSSQSHKLRNIKGVVRMRFASN